MEVRGAAFQSPDLEDVGPVVGAVGHGLDLEILEWEQLDVSLVWLLHVDKANTTENIKAIFPVLVKHFALFEQKANLVCHQVVA